MTPWKESILDEEGVHSHLALHFHRKAVPCGVFIYFIPSSARYVFLINHAKYLFVFSVYFGD